jgi:hypothetical protein
MDSPGIAASSHTHSAADSLLIGATARLATSANSTRSMLVVNRRTSVAARTAAPTSRWCHSWSSSQTDPVVRASTTSSGAVPAAAAASAASDNPSPSPKCRLLTELRQRFTKFGLELHPGKTRLIEFGRYAARERRQRGLGKPETFDFLGFTHICAKSRKGTFWIKRITIAKRARAKLKEINEQLKRRRHEPIPVQGQWLASVLRGHVGYYAVPGNSDAVSTFRYQVTRLWHKALRRRSQRNRITWERINRYATRWIPQVRIMHPYPEVRLAAKTQGRSPVR